MKVTLPCADKMIEATLNEIIEGDENKKQHYIEPKTYKRINKNIPKDIDLSLKSFEMFEGIDLLAIEGMSYSTVLAIMEADLEQRSETLRRARDYGIFG